MLEETPRPETASNGHPAEDPPLCAPQIIEIFGADPLVDRDEDTTPADPETPRDAGTSTNGTPAASSTAASSTAVDPAAADGSAANVSTTDSAAAAPKLAAADTTPEPPAAAGGGALPGELEPRFAALETAVERLGRQASFLPPKLRGLGERIDALSTVLAHARCRTLLTEVLAIDDLVHAGLADLQRGDELAPERVLTALRATLTTLLDSQGVTEIEASGPFDPARHQAVRQLPVDEAQFDGAVLEVDRRGFAHGEQVLRFAEVAVGRHEPDGEASSGAEHEPDAAPTDTPTHPEEQD